MPNDISKLPDIGESAWGHEIPGPGRYHRAPCHTRSGSTGPERLETGICNGLHDGAVSEACGNCPLQGTRLCTQLAGPSLGRLREISRRVHFKANCTVAGACDKGGFSGVVRHGWLRLVHYTRNGKRKIADIFEPGDLVIELNGVPAGFELETVTPAELCRFDTAGFERLLENDQSLCRAVMRDGAERFDRTLQRNLIAALSAPERVAAYLVFEAAKSGFRPDGKGGGDLTLALPRPEIADLIGTTVETFSRVTHGLQQCGAIEILSPNRFRIPSLAALDRLGARTYASSDEKQG
ncbi:cAMP-binding domain of CRP or a regulatory subunit of cAMP-dependent protein kinases [Aliiruegeria lutimaris]|uniref:cAMP-binding domain of CRP or a regulatory subunit of cAMP-dependent protein kinases n=2 Tax=Aliiruegeria lutimaris TaxID=571298 RepID=A0A1G8QR97_9RHOB|nr:cAMP-binding domain of CRP or a regulatory subunit of cAMP-dependent protein kinases [Aliiruegeria lutimaris]